MRVKFTLLLSITVFSLLFGNKEYIADSVKIITDAQYIDDSTILVIDTLKKTDTMVVYIENQIKPTFEVSFSINPTLNISPYYSNNVTYNTITNQLNNELTNKISYSICLNLYYLYSNYIIGSGFQYLNIIENISHIPENFLIQSFPYQKLDTVSTWGQIVNGDTSYISEIEWNTYYNFDTTYLKKKYKNTFKYIEIPIFVGKRIKINQFNVDLNLGFINQFFINSKNDVLLLNSDKNLYSFKKNNFNKYILSYSLSINCSNELNQKINLLYGINYSKSISSKFKNDFYYKHNYLIIGLKFGIIIKL